jgi:hypothetical protein
MQKQLQEYLDRRYAESQGSIDYLTNGDKTLFAYMQLMWTNQFWSGRAEELDRVVNSDIDRFIEYEREITSLKAQLKIADKIILEGSKE